MNETARAYLEEALRRTRDQLGRNYKRVEALRKELEMEERFISRVEEEAASLEEALSTK